MKATIKFLGVPEKNQTTKDKVINYKLYLAKDGTIKRSFMKLPDGKPDKTPEGELIYEISDNVQIIFESEDGFRFINNYFPKYTKEVVTNGYLNTSIVETELVDPLRDYFIEPVISQLGLDATDSNLKVLKHLIKNKIYIEFYEHNTKSTNGKTYINYRVSKPVDTRELVPDVTE
jgi:hypothetical protein